MTKRVFLTILLSSALSAHSAFCEDPARGRLPDGRAYRTDQSGTQLVDYIAELEVNLDTLNRKVRGLEDELKEKQRALEQAGVKDASGGKIVEKSLAGEAPLPSHDEFNVVFA